MVSFTRVALTVYLDIQGASYTHVVENISISVKHKIFEIKKIDIGLTRRKKKKKNRNDSIWKKKFREQISVISMMLRKSYI